MEIVDTLTDVVGRPVPVCFQSLRAHHKVYLEIRHMPTDRPYHTTFALQPRIDVYLPHTCISALQKMQQYLNFTLQQEL